MILSDNAIQQAIATGKIEIDPIPDQTRYTSSAVDLTLGPRFQGWNLEVLQVKGVRIELNLAEQSYQSTAGAYLKAMDLEADGSYLFPPYRLHPIVLLAQTRERVFLKRESEFAARVEGRSSLARIGLTVHLTAPTIHCGFSGPITLELINYSPFYLRMVPGTVICQLIIERVEGTPGKINTAFQNQTDPSGISIK
jgi:dCTP deaminase